MHFPQRLKLKNGLVVNYVPADITGLFRIEVIIKRGVVDENIHESSYSHFIEHLMASMLSKKYNKNVDEMFTRWGINHNAWTDNRCCGYYLEGLDEFAYILTDILMNNYVHPVIKEFNQEKNAVIRELYTRINSPWYNLDSMMNYVNFPFTNLAFLDEHSIENIKNITHKEILKFRKRIYIPENTVINIVSSKFSKFSLVTNIIKDFCGQQTSIRVASPYKKSNIKQSAFHARAVDNIFYTPSGASPSKDEIANIVVQIDLPFTAFDNDAYIFDFFTTFLTDGLGSHLYKILRSKLGVIYSIKSEASPDPLDANMSKFVISTETSKIHVPIVVTSILRELGYLHLTINESDIEHYRNRVKTDYLNNTSFLKYLGHYRNYLVWEATPLTIEQVIERKLNATTKQLKKLANDVFTAKNTKIFYSSATRANIPASELHKEDFTRLKAVD
jgi:predicted Zn-dependent peptidase